MICIFSVKGSKELLSVISTLESIDGLVIKKLRRGSLKIETEIHKLSALKSLITHFETGRLFRHLLCQSFDNIMILGIIFVDATR